MSYNPDLAPPRLPRQGALGERQYDSDRNLMTYTDDAAGGYRDSSPPAEKAYTPRVTNPRKRKLLWGLVALVVIAGAIAIGVAVGVTQANKNNGKSGSAGSGAEGDTNTGNSDGGVATPGPPADPNTPVTNTTAPVKGGSGATGSLVTTDLNVTFTYVNDFGGRWAYDPNSPFNVSPRRL